MLSMDAYLERRNDHPGWLVRSASSLQEFPVARDAVGHGVRPTRGDHYVHALDARGCVALSDGRNESQIVRSDCFPRACLVNTINSTRARE